MEELRTQLNTLLDRLQETVESLSPRDRKLVISMAAGALVMILALSGWWMSASLDSLREKVADRTETLRLVQLLAEDNQLAKQEVEKIRSALLRHKGTDLSAFLEQSASKTGIRDRLDSVRETSTTADEMLEEKQYTVSLSKLSVQEYSNFLYQVETAQYPLKIRSSKVKTSARKDPKELRITLDISAFKLVEEDEG